MQHRFSARPQNIQNGLYWRINAADDREIELLVLTLAARAAAVQQEAGRVSLSLPAGGYCP